MKTGSRYCFDVDDLKAKAKCIASLDTSFVQTFEHFQVFWNEQTDFFKSLVSCVCLSSPEGFRSSILNRCSTGVYDSPESECVNSSGLIHELKGIHILPGGQQIPGLPVSSEYLGDGLGVSPIW